MIVKPEVNRFITDLLYFKHDGSVDVQTGFKARRETVPLNEFKLIKSLEKKLAKHYRNNVVKAGSKDRLESLDYKLQEGETASNQGQGFYLVEGEVEFTQDEISLISKYFGEIKTLDVTNSLEAIEGVETLIQGLSNE